MVHAGCVQISSLNIGVVFDQLDDGNIEYTIRLRQPYIVDSWDTGSRGDTITLGPRTFR